MSLEGIAVAAVACALACATTLTRCASGGDNSIAPEGLAEAATLTGAVKGANIAVRASTTPPGSKRPVTITGNGVQDFQHRAATYTFDFAPLVEAQHATGIDRSKLRLDGVYSGHWSYMRSPLFERELPKGKKWIGIDLARLLRAGGIDPSGLLQSGNPADALSYLRASSGDARRIGQEEVRGTETTHYKGVADLRRVPGVGRRSAQRLITLTGTSKIPEDVWVDAHRYVRRMRLPVSYKTPPGSPGAGQRVSFDETIEFYGFGPKPPVKPPPAREVFDATDVAARGLRAG
jgi:hypothetical protein